MLKHLSLVSVIDASPPKSLQSHECSYFEKHLYAMPWNAEVHMYVDSPLGLSYLRKIFPGPRYILPKACTTVQNATTPVQKFLGTYTLNPIYPYIYIYIYIPIDPFTGTQLLGTWTLRGGSFSRSSCRLVSGLACKHSRRIPGGCFDM